MVEVAAVAAIEDKEDHSLVIENTKNKKIERKRKLIKDLVLIVMKEIERRKNIDLGRDLKTSAKDMKTIMREKKKGM